MNDNLHGPGTRVPSEPCPCRDGQACEIHDEMPDDELEMRRKMVQEAMRYVQEQGDPYLVMGRYKIQAKNIHAASNKRKNKSEKPPPTSVGLKTGTLAGKILPGGG